MSSPSVKFDKRKKTKGGQRDVLSSSDGRHSGTFHESTRTSLSESREVPQHISTTIPRKKRPIPSHDDKSYMDQDLFFKQKKGSSLYAAAATTSNLNSMKRTSNLRDLAPTRQKPSRGEGENPIHIRIISRTPLVVGANFRCLPVEVLNCIGKGNSSSQRLRVSGRTKKRKIYVEAKESDSDFLEDSDDDGEASFKRPKKRLQKISSKKSFEERQIKSNVFKIVPNRLNKGNDQPPIINGEDVTAPPTGMLSSLWYSQEIFSHIWVIDKIIGWKKRRKISISYKNDSVETLNEATSKEISDKLINYFIPRSSTRMELSRISPITCPMVLTAFAEQQIRKLKKHSANASNAEDQNNDLDGVVSLNHSGKEMEEVLLIKWRGKSHIHCSWERPGDLEIFDTTNNTAKGKIKRYYQSQHMALGKDWKDVLEIRHRSKSEFNISETTKKWDENNKILHLNDHEEHFSSDCAEVERILACDEFEMDMNVLALQRKINLKLENDEIEFKRSEIMSADDAITKDHTKDHFLFLDEEKPWDPEDNVRYVVKWKSLQLTEITWEYWMHIKHQSVDEAKDFWDRQKPLEVNSKNQNHPLVRDYKKLAKSPVFGVASKKRSIGNSDDSGRCDSNSKVNQDTDSMSGLQLRSYQLEGVNWLIWNWWNKRSCILADEMVRKRIFPFQNCIVSINYSHFVFFTGTWKDNSNSMLFGSTQ